MKAILVFIDGTICDTRARHPFLGTPEFERPERMLADLPVPGSLACLGELARCYRIVYIGARPETARPATKTWLEQMGFPHGPLILAESQVGRLALVRGLTEKPAEHLDFIAGIGDRWDDNELHSELPHSGLGCLSIILQEYAGDWSNTAGRIERFHRRQVMEINCIHLAGKVQGLARVCPLLLSKYGEGLWQAYLEAVLEMAERSRDARRAEDLASFAEHGLNPTDLRDAARWDALLREMDWEENPAYGLQEFELVEATPTRYIHRVTRCAYAELWQRHGRPDIGYQIHCRTDQAWWDRPAWNPAVRFEQPQTIMQGHEACVFIQYLPG